MEARAGPIEVRPTRKRGRKEKKKKQRKEERKEEKKNRKGGELTWKFDFLF